MKPSVFSRQEEKVLAFWDKERIFERSLEQTKDGKPFVFYEGPPTANGKPGIHHILARAFKDLVPRFETMRGRYVARKAGWDTHGLPVELEVEKRLNLKSKRDIENLVPGDSFASIVKFNDECRKSVWTYLSDWQKLTTRMGYWIDLKHPYITYERSYIETLWYIIKQVFDKGLLKKVFRVQPFCTRCGTGLSSHELALGYKKVKERAIFVKFKLKPGQRIGNTTTDNSTYILSWTTTPWTLPGNVALAVNKDVLYCAVKKEEAVYILAKERIALLSEPYDILGEFKGAKLAGLSYEPLFDIPALASEQSYKVYAAEFVTADEGTGIVHTAAMYGEDDFSLGEAVGLPTVHTVNEDGTFNELVPELSGRYVKDKAAEEAIIAKLHSTGALVKTEQYEHEYPFCWRCHTPLLYMARDAWVIEMSKLRAALVANNEHITWEPAHIKNGRFGEWLKKGKDWTFSRERYWGTPLPIWECEKCQKVKAIGTVEELRLNAAGANTYFFVRHGESDHNVKGICGPHEDTAEFTSRLTKKGREQAAATAAKLKREGVDYIVSSPLARTKETAEIIAAATGAPVSIEPALVDVNPGVFAGKQVSEVRNYLAEVGRQKYFDEGLPEGESGAAVQARVVGVIQRLNDKYKGKKIVVVGHGDPLVFLRLAFEGGGPNDFKSIPYPDTGALYDIKAGPLPLNAAGEVDLHRPYIDGVTLKCACGGRMKRVPYVCDVWFDSGSMPFAQQHWLGGEEALAGTFPADYICEAVDQTRGWFYTLLAVATLLDKGTPFKKAISLGLILDSKGEKMSKSRGNIVDPWEQIALQGIDPIRWYFFVASVPGMPKRYDEKVIRTHFNRFFVTLWNTFRFLELYAPKDGTLTGTLVADGKAKLPLLDEWIVARAREVNARVTIHIEALKITAAARELEKFVTDLSNWYVRRSRERLQAGEDESRSVLASVLVTTATLLAPFTPLFAERLYRALRPFLAGTDWPVSVHLMAWPQAPKLSKHERQTLTDIRAAREIVAEGLKQRMAAALKVRQPLAKVTAPKLSKALAKIVAEELNVKMVSEGKVVKLDTTLTPSLVVEGYMREIARHAQIARKELALTPNEAITLAISKTPQTEEVLKAHKAELMKAVKATAVELRTGLKAGKAVTLGEARVYVAITKA